MTQTTRPQKEEVRQYMARRQEESEPPPSPEEIRRQLGWGLVEAERESMNKGR